MLAARRRLPAALAGGWEFPGGKVETGETEQQALIRECREELGVLVECDAGLPGQWPIGESMVLRVHLARVVGGEPAPGADHDLIRWLAPNQIAEVRWLPADVAAAEWVARWLADSAG